MWWCVGQGSTRTIAATAGEGREGREAQGEGEDKCDRKANRTKSTPFGVKSYTTPAPAAEGEEGEYYTKRMRLKDGELEAMGPETKIRRRNKRGSTFRSSAKTNKGVETIRSCRCIKLQTKLHSDHTRHTHTRCNTLPAGGARMKERSKEATSS